MNEISPNSLRPNAHLRQDEVEGLAARALQVLSSAPDGSVEDTPLAQLFALTEAYIDVDENARHDILARIMNSGVSTGDVIETVVPATARYLGKLWAHNKLSFAEVTIGAARLQETVRSIGHRRPQPYDLSDRPAVLLVVPRSEQHTLGIFVVAEQMRRAGAQVHLALGNEPREMKRLIIRHNIRMVGISASSRRTLASVRDLIKTIRAGVPRIVPIVVGGTVTSLEVDIRTVTGADHVCSDPVEALRICGVQVQPQEGLGSM